MSRYAPLAVLSGLVLFLMLGLAPGCNNAITEPTEGDASEKAAPPEKIEPVAFDLENLPDNPRVIMKTSEGDITLEFDNLKAPLSTKNFLRYAQDGHFDNTIFHRVMSGFMIQGGGFTESLYENARAMPKTTRDPIKNESTNGLSNVRGTIAMARRTDPDSATAQFFINVVDNSRGLDYPSNGGYTVFGKVVAGMEVVEAIRHQPVKRWGNHEALPEKLVEILSVEPVLE